MDLDSGVMLLDAPIAAATADRIPISEEHHAAAEALFRKVAREHEEGRVKRGPRRIT